MNSMRILPFLFLIGCSFPNPNHKHRYEVWACSWEKAPCTMSGELKTCISECGYCDDGIAIRVVDKRGDFTPVDDCKLKKY
jgi:hypothetical protein